MYLFFINLIMEYQNSRLLIICTISIEIWLVIMSKNNKKKKEPSSIFDATLPPCSRFLGNVNPLILDDFLIYRNQNRLFYFISTNPSNEFMDISKILSYTNLQISLTNYLISLYIFNVENKNCEYDPSYKIHNDHRANSFIHESLNSSVKLNLNYIPSLSLTISNGNAILPLYTNTVNISPLNYYITLGLHLIENNPALFFGNNAFALEDGWNIDLAHLALNFKIF